MVKPLLPNDVITFNTLNNPAQAGLFKELNAITSLDNKGLTKYKALIVTVENSYRFYELSFFIYLEEWLSTA